MVQVNNKGRTFTELSWLEIAHVFAELIGAQVVINYKSGYSCYVDYHYTRQDGIQCCTGVAKIKTRQKNLQNGLCGRFSDMGRIGIFLALDCRNYSLNLRKNWP